MINHNQNGAVNGLLISFIMTILLLLIALGFGGWAFSSRADYKNHVDAKVSRAVKAAKEAESVAKDKDFAEQAKLPFKVYSGPADYASLHLEFPKTWSGYVDDSGKGSNAPVDGYFFPGVVPSITDPASVFALRVQVLSQSYDKALQTISSQQQSSKLTVTAYALPKLPNIVGVRVSGELTQGKNTTMIILPLRSQTLEISTEGNQYLNDFNNNILPNFSYQP